MIAAILIAGIAFAGMPPTEAIPWDSVLVTDTIPAGVNADGSVNARMPIILDHWCYFITLDKYEAEVLGQRTKQDVRSIKRDLEVIKALLKESGK